MPSFNSATSIMRAPRIHRQHLRPWNHAPAWHTPVRVHSPSGGVRAFGNPGIRTTSPSRLTGAARLTRSDEETMHMMGLGWLGQDGGDGGGDIPPPDISPSYPVVDTSMPTAPNIIDVTGTPLDNAGTPALISELSPQVQQANINELIASAPGTLTPQEVADIYAGQPITAADMAAAVGAPRVTSPSGTSSGGGSLMANPPKAGGASQPSSALAKALQSLLSPSGTASTSGLSAAQLAALQAAGVPYMGGALTAAQQAVLAGGSSASILPGISNTTLMIGGALLIGAMMLLKK